MNKSLRRLLKRIPLFYDLAKRTRDHFRAVRVGRWVRRLQASSQPIRIVIGAWGVSDAGWVPTDAEYLNLTNPAHWVRYFRADSIDAILAEHVWEHLTEDEALAAAKHCYHYLKPGGYVRVAVPDGYNPNPKYIEAVKVGGIGPGAHDHKVLYNYKTLCRLFDTAGFTVDLLEYYDEQGVFHHEPWSVQQGTIHRSQGFGADKRHKVDGITYSEGDIIYRSIIIDAHKC
ncbi:MAG: methyltransferase domain-containing protein [Chloroflexi bacterium]|nr:methyltransferase domain-containing protein [Chloroflexota bacterium]